MSMMLSWEKERLPVTEGPQKMIPTGKNKWLLISYGEWCQICDLLRRFNFGTRDQAWSLKSFCISQFSSVTQSCLTLCDPMDHSTPGLPVHHQLPEFTQTHAYRVSDAIQPSHPLLSSPPPAFNLSQHQGLFKWVSSLYHMAEILELQLQHQFFQLIFRTDFL